MASVGTIATHNGSQVALGHNRRDRRITSKEEHIDPRGQHENWVDCESVERAYERIFGQAIEEYNAKQVKNRHYDKQTSVNEFLKEIEQDRYKKPIYEMVVGVYGGDSSPQQKKEILWDFAKGWKERNPNLVMVGCYWHNDEAGEQHLHIDYIPIYHANKRGIGIKQGLNKALEEQGIEEPQESKGRFDKWHTRQIEWQKRENAYLEELCNEKGISVERSSFTREHEDTQDYKRRMLTKSNRELKEENEKLMETNKKQHEVNTKNNKALHRQVEQYKALQEELQHMQESLQKGQKALERMKDEYIDEVHQYASKDAKEHFKKGLEW